MKSEMQILRFYVVGQYGGIGVQVWNEGGENLPGGENEMKAGKCANW